MDQTFGEEYDLMFQIVREQMMLRRAERNAQPLVIQLQRDENNEDHFTVVLGRGLQPTAPVAAPRPARPNHSSSPTGPSDAALMPILEEIGPLILQALVFQALLGDQRHRMAAPLDPSTLRELQRMKLSREIVARLEAEGQGVCSICQETFGASAYVYRLPCGHLFDLACLEMWLQRTRTCPNCRFLLQDVEQQYKDAVTPMWWLCENAEKNSDPNTASEVVVGQVKSIADNAPITHAEVLQTPSRWDTAFRRSSGVTPAQSASVSAVSIAVPNALHNSLVGTANLNEQNELDESSPLVLPLLRRSTHSRHGRAFQEENSYPQQVVAVTDDEQPQQQQQQQQQQSQQQPKPPQQQPQTQQQPKPPQQQPQTQQQQQQQQRPKPRPPPPPPSPQSTLDTRDAPTPPRTAESLQTLHRPSGRLGIPPNEGLPPLGEAHPTPVAPFGAPQAQVNEAADHRRRVREWTPGGLSRSVSNSSGDVYIMPHTPPQVMLNESNCPVAGNARQAVNAIRRYRVEDTARPRHRAVTAARAATRPSPPHPPAHPPAHPPLPIERHHRPSDDRRTQGARHNGGIDNGSSQRAIGNAGQRNASDVTGENETREATRRRHSGARGINGGGNYRNLAQYEAIIRGQLRYPRGH